MKTKLSHYYLLPLLLFLCSCEVELHENFLPIEPLPPFPIEMTLYVAQNSDGELVLTPGQEISYKINSPGNLLMLAAFYVEGRKIYESEYPEGKFKYMGNNDTGKSQLKCVLTLKRMRGGDSILDQLARDQIHESEINWPVSNFAPEFTFYQEPEDVSLENITVRWKFNVPGYYFNVYHNEKLIASKTTAQSITFPTPPFGSHNYIKVRIVNEQGEESFSYEPPLYKYTGVTRSYGNGVQLRNIYSPYSNTWYTSNYNEVTSYSFPDLKTISEFKDVYGSNATPIAVAPNSNKVAVEYNYGYLRLFTGRDLESSVIVYYPESNYAASRIFLTSNNKLILYYTHLSKAHVYNADNGQLEKTVSFREVHNDSQYDFNPQYNQLNEQYLFQPLQSGGFYITSLQDFEAVKTTFYQSGDYYQASFHPIRPNELLLGNNDGIVTIDCRNGQIIRKVNKEAGWVFYNIDPVTGNYLFATNQEVIITSEDGKVLFRYKSISGEPYLANNMLTCREGCAMNVEPYLKK